MTVESDELGRHLGEGWWLASDGNWYPPESRPHPTPPAAAAQPLTEAPTRRSGKRIALWSVAILFGLGVVGNLAPDADEQSDGDSIAATTESTNAPAAEATTTPAARKAEATTVPPTAPKTTEAPTTTSPPTTTTTINVKALRVIDMQAWVNDNLSIMGEISNDMNEVTDAASSYDIDELQSACLGLRGSVMQAQGVRAIPEPSVNAPWQKALASYKKAADACIAGARSVDANLITQASGYLGDGTAYLQDATLALQEWMSDNKV